MPTKPVRASALPLLTTCPPAGQPTEMSIEPVTPESRLGNAVHKVIAHEIVGKKFSYADAAREESVDASEVAILSRMAMRRWREARQFFPDPTTELTIEVPGLWLMGTIDVFSIVGEETGKPEARILDHKTGFADLDHSAQLRGYGYLAMHKYPRLQSAYMAVINVRSGERDAERLTREELLAWGERTQVRLAETGAYNPGSWCAYCPRVYSCKARTEGLQESLKALESRLSFAHYECAGELFPAYEPQRALRMAQTLDRVRMIEDACQTLRAAIKAEVLKEGGRLPTGDGREFVIVEQQRTQIDLRKAMPVIEKARGDIVYLREPVPPDAIADAMSINKGKLETAFANAAMPGQKAKAINALQLRLLEADALIPVTVPRLECKRVPAAIPSAPGPSPDPNQSADASGA